MNMVESNSIISLVPSTDQVIRKQLDRKRGLDNELQRDKLTLENMEYEILILKATITTADLERLIEEIKLLQLECDSMTAKLDKSGLGDTNSLNLGLNCKFFFFVWF